MHLPSKQNVGGSSPSGQAKFIGYAVKQQVIELHSKGLTKKQISEKLEIGYSTVKKYTKGLKTIIPNTKYVCRSCNKAGKNFFYKNLPYQCKNCWNHRTYNSTLEKVAEYMASRGGAKCQKCGYDRYVGALEFHHRDPIEKDPKWHRGWSISKLAIELDKCDILCSNCHREVHAEMRIQKQRML